MSHCEATIHVEHKINDFSKEINLCDDIEEFIEMLDYLYKSYLEIKILFYNLTNNQFRKELKKLNEFE